MKFRNYMFSKTITLSILMIGGISVGIAMAFANAGIQIILMLFTLYITFISLWLLISYLFERNKIIKLNDITDKLSDKYLLGELIPKPKKFIDLQYHHVIKTVSHSAIGVVEQTKKDKEDYCEYVESWIHEIKTPLTACSLILANGGDVNKLKTELKTADNLTETILYYARLRTVEKDRQIKEFNVLNVVEEAIKSQMELLIAAKIRVETKGDFKVYSDSKALCFIIKQLLINCAKYCPECLIIINSENGKIQVEDNGIGIPKHELGRVTERGFTGLISKTLGGSTGMGLYIVQELCERLEISMNIDSEPNIFTRVTLTFNNITKM